MRALRDANTQLAATAAADNRLLGIAANDLVLAGSFLAPQLPDGYAPAAA